MLCKYGKRTLDFWGRFYFYFDLAVFYTDFGGIFNKTIIPLVLAGYKMIMVNSALRR